MTRRVIDFATTTVPDGPSHRGNEDATHAWVALCEHVYQRGLRLVPVSEGGLPILWQVTGRQWATKVTVEPVELRPAHYVVPMPTEGTTGAVEARRRGLHSAEVVTGCHCDGCAALRARINQRRAERMPHVTRAAAGCHCEGCNTARAVRNQRRNGAPQPPQP